MHRRDIDRIQEELDELFADLWQVPRFVGRRHGFRPHVDCFRTETRDALTVVVELAGRRPGRASRSPSPSAPSRSPVTRRRPPHACRVVLPADGDRVRPVPAADRARRGRRSRARPRRPTSAACSRSCLPTRAQAPRRPHHDRGRRAAEERMSELEPEVTLDDRRGRDPGRPADLAAEGDGRLPAVDDAARDRPGALDQADRRRRRRRPPARARDRRTRTVDRPRLGRPLRGRHGRDRPQDDQASPTGRCGSSSRALHRIRLDRPDRRRPVPRRRVRARFRTSSRRRPSSRR